MQNSKFYKKTKFSFPLLLLDTILISISWMSAYWIRYSLNGYIGKPINPYHSYLSGLPVIIGMWLLVSGSFGLYRRKKNITKLENLHSLLKSILLGSLITMSIAFLFKEFDFARLVIFLFIGLNFLFLGAARFLVRKTKEALIAKGYDKVSIIIAGAGVIGIRAMQKLIDHPETGYEIIGFLDDDPDKLGQKIGGVEILGKLEDISRIVAEKAVQEVFIAIPSLPHKEILKLIIECEDYAVNFRIVTDLFEVLTGDANFDVIEDFPIVELKNGSVSAGYEPGRRVFDLIISISAFIISFPLWILIIIAVKLDSKGSAIFSQERVGKNGKIFQFYKFRTMYVDAPKYEIAPKEKDDPRITKIGGFLRRTSLDELPQLVNVIKGDMSIVGPRPEMPFIVKTYEKWQKRRLDVKPGITGLWQIIGRKDLPLHENLEYDFYYIKNRSILFDFTILLKTIPAILFRRGAY